MSETNEKEKSKSNNPALFNVESFNKAVASRDEIIVAHENTISTLEEQIGKQQTTISDLMKKTKSEESARIAAESELAQKKELKVEHKGNYFKTEEEKFADSFSKE
ncbi:14274_t:CDS:1 [Funneliformis geosporum]|nr:14274_t:CDS:1 [Funneliformis geosporum]